MAIGWRPARWCPARELWRLTGLLRDATTGSWSCVRGLSRAAALGPAGSGDGSRRDRLALASPAGMMKPRITLLTLAVDDLERAVTFYRDGLGLPTKGVVGREFEHGAVAFFDLQGGLKLALWSRTDLAHDTGLPPTPPSPTDFALAHNVRTREEVDQVMVQAAKAGGKVLKPPAPAFWGGYTGYFQDPDGHLWEVAWNPSLMPPD
jgi:uncharacterized protein